MKGADNVILEDNMEEDLIIEEETNINATITGNVTVKSSAVMQLYGTITKDLIVDEGSKAYVFGCVNGSIINNGELEVYGEVSGEVIDHTGKAFVSRKAVVGGKAD